MSEPLGALPSFTLPVRTVGRATPRALLLVLDSSGARLAFRPGQAAWLARPGQPGMKPYSIASAPSDHTGRGTLEFLVGLEEDGEPGAHLAGLTEGAQVIVTGPIGGIELPASDTGRHVLLVAGGTGIAPLRSIWRELLVQAPLPSLAVVYSARRAEDFAFGDELAGLADAGRARVTMTVTRDDPGWTGPRGRVSVDLLARSIARPADTRCAICGPAGLVAHVAHGLTRLGVPLAQIATERW